jgi:hypothetical protein
VIGTRQGCSVGRCQASDEATMSTIRRSRTGCPGPRVRTFCTSSRRPHGAARAAYSARTPQLPLTLPLRRRQRRSAGAKGIASGPRNPGSHQGRSGFDKGTLAAALIGLMRAGGSQPDPPTSIRAATPCQIRRSVTCSSPRSLVPRSQFQKLSFQWSRVPSAYPR